MLRATNKSSLLKIASRRADGLIPADAISFFDAGDPTDKKLRCQPRIQLPVRHPWDCLAIRGIIISGLWFRHQYTIPLPSSVDSVSLWFKFFVIWNAVAMARMRPYRAHEKDEQDEPQRHRVHREHGTNKHKKELPTNLAIRFMALVPRREVSLRVSRLNASIG
jgi:hypothetical protein